MLLRDDAAWTWFHSPQAIRDGDVTYVTWSSHVGIHIGQLNHTSGDFTTFQLHTNSDVDDHHVAAVGIRPDGRILAAYCEHNDSIMRARISTNVGDVSAWGTEITAATAVSGTGVTYPNLIYLSSESTWYLFYRDFPDVFYITSADDGATWSAPTTLVDNSPERPYVKYVDNGLDQIHLLLTDKHPANLQASVYHMWYDAGTWRDSAGSDAGTLPIPFANMTQIHDGVAGDNSWVWDIVLDGDTPVIAYTTFPSIDDHRYWYGRFVGGAWVTHEVAAAGGAIDNSGSEPYYSAGIGIDHSNPDGIYLALPRLSDTWDIQRWITDDGGATWPTGQNIAVGGKNMRPVSVRGGPAAVVWFEGFYDHWTTFDTDMHYVAPLAPPTAPVVPGAFVRSLSGSQLATFEARVLSTFQTGSDPAGTTIPILGGSVIMDATAKVQRILDLETAGADEADSRRSVYPRRAADLLAPFGTEIFVRRGIDIGTEVLWIPLGYYRIDSAEQDDSPYGPIRLSGSDRMAGIVDARPLQPEEFEATRTVASVFAELVGDVYPDATILFDDESAAATIGRVLVMEESRFAVLQEIATSLGKIMFWDGTGVLRVVTAPDEDTPVWEVKAGHNGVLINAARRVTREGMFNAVVATGEAGETDVPPVVGVAVDAGPNSPTRWGGRFGKVPRFYSSPFITTQIQADNAARQMLRRSIGAPYAVDFGTVVNASLQPYDPIRVTQQDGNRELHVVERLTIPLTAEDAMSGSTREKTLVVIGGV